MDDRPVPMQRAGEIGGPPLPPPRDDDALLAPEWLDALLGTAFLSRCASGTATRAELDTFARQHHHYARHFTRYLAAVIAALPFEDDRASLSRNLFEETGLGEPGSKPHALLYREMLAALGLDPAEEPMFPSTLALRDTMLALCGDDDPLVGLGALCLGAEAIVPRVYAAIVEGFLAVGVPRRDLAFFQIHIEGDDAHAATMRAILGREIGSDPGAMGRVRRGAMAAIEARVRFFEGVSERHTPIRPATGPASGTAAPGLRANHDGNRETTMSSRSSSKDFGRTPTRLEARMPDKLIHNGVERTSLDARFSEERKHPVFVVDLPTVALSMTIGGLEPGGRTNRHRHTYETVIYVIEGRGSTTIEDTRVEWEAGDAIYVPVWAWHHHENASATEPCRYVAAENAPLLQNLGGVAIREEG